MLKHPIQYTDFNDEEVTEDLYFNITQTELAENMDMESQARALQTLYSGPDRTLSPDEIRMVLAMVKRVMKLAYGKRSEDGKRFIKSEDIWTDFSQTAAYDAFLMDLFKNPDKIEQFILGVIPKDLRSQVVAARETGTLETLPQASNTSVAEEDTRPAWLREGRKPTKAELSSMSREELFEAMRDRVSE